MHNTLSRLFNILNRLNIFKAPGIIHIFKLLCILNILKLLSIPGRLPIENLKYLTVSIVCMYTA